MLVIVYAVFYERRCDGLAGVDFLTAAMVQTAKVSQSKPQSSSSSKDKTNSFENALKSEAEKVTSNAEKNEQVDNNSEKTENSQKADTTDTTKESHETEKSSDTNETEAEKSPEALEVAATFVQMPVLFEQFAVEETAVQIVPCVVENKIVEPVNNTPVQLVEDTVLAPEKGIEVPTETLEAVVLPKSNTEPVVVDVKEKLMTQQQAAEPAKEVAVAEVKKEETNAVAKQQEVKPEIENNVESRKIVVENTESAESAKTENNNSETQNNDFSFVLENKPVVEGKFVDTKVGEAVNVNRPDFAEKIGEKILLSKNNEVEIQLEPENLGKIQIKLIFDKGETRISVLCTNSKAAEIMSNNSEGLAAVVESRTGTSTTVEVAQEKDNLYKDDYQDGHNNQQNKENQSEKQRKERESKSNPTDFLHQLRLGLI